MKPEQIATVDPFDFIMIPTDQNQQLQFKFGNPLLEESASTISKKIGDFEGKYYSFITSLFSSQYRLYFDVDNQYILRKLTLLHAPIIYKGDWTLNDESQKFSQTKNIHSLDLYLPLMGLITLVLLRCLNAAISNAIQYTSIYMINTFWKCLLVSAIEVVITRILFCLFGNFKVTIIDLISTSNYKYCNLSTLYIFNLITFHIFSAVATIYILFSQAIFVYKSSQICIEKHDQNNQEHENSFEPTLAFIISMLQITCSCVLLYVL
ncbi:unnamed protein product [Paramecium sonneborni]|uniref:Protein YIF1 n=1 Tax=Paramecium sonneborni TaxID=65129 RepID=A0A8S1LKY9_9CILI|nr:unnamed protein product [Paramecium sonneborni]